MFTVAKSVSFDILSDVADAMAPIAGHLLKPSRVRVSSRYSRRKGTMRPIFSLLTAAALLAVPLVAGAETLVEVGHNRLEPAAITIKSGDTVTFVNQGPDARRAHDRR